MDERAAFRANLGPSDFPSDWTRDSQDEPHYAAFAWALASFCRREFATVDELEAAREEVTAAHSSDEFSSPTVGVITTEVEVFRTAATAMALLDATFDACAGELVAVAEEFVYRDDRAKVVGFEVSELTTRASGDWARDWGVAAKYRFTPSGEPINVTLTFTFVRVGRVTGTFALLRYAEGGPDDAGVVESLLQTFMERLADESATISD